MNKYLLHFFICLGLFSVCTQVPAQTDSASSSFSAYKRILGNTNFAIGQIRGFHPGDSMAVVFRSEKAILEAQGDDYLYYRILCNSVMSAEISYTFDANGLLISIGIEFFETCIQKEERNLSDECLIDLLQNFKNCKAEETDTFQYISESGMHMEFQKSKDEMCIMHTQIEFY